MISKKRLHLLSFTFCLLLFCGCVAKTPIVIPPTVSIPKEIVSLKSLCEKYNVQWSWDNISQIIILKSNTLEAKALVGSNIVLLRGKRIVLSAPVKIEKSMIVVPSDFNRKVMDAIKEKGLPLGNLSVRKIKTVLIDPGHGGKDPGAIGFSGTKEKDVVLSIATQLRNLLIKRGFNVEMTRSRDKFITLEKRTEIASHKKVDFFISIHANSSKSRRAFGIEVFSLRKLSVSEVNSDQRKRNQWLLFKHLSMKADDNLKSILSDMLYDNKCFQDDLLASYATKKLSKYARAKNRGYKKAGFFVLKHTIMPAILVEVGFLSNPREERLLKTRSYRSKIARSLAQIIINYNKYSDDELCKIMNEDE